MKKQLLTLGTIGAIAAPIAAVVSCGNAYGPNYRYYGDIQVITDAGSVGDKSFNQSSFEAVRDYTELVATDKTFGFSQPKTPNNLLLSKAYLSALKKGVKTLVLPGFIHGDPGAGNAIKFVEEHVKDFPDANYISAEGFADNNTWEHLLKPDTDPDDKTKYVLDNKSYQVDTKDKMGDVTKTSTFTKIDEARKDASSANNKSIKMQPGAGEYAINKYLKYYNLGYAAAESGFLAAVYGGLYFNKVKNVSSPIKAATFGGMPVPFGVTSYMDGYLQGINWWNSKVNSSSNNFQKIEAIFSKGKKASASDFTGTFDAGSATPKSTKLITNGAQIILPVAGPQTGDVIGVIKAQNKTGDVFAFGVDTDQTKVYDPSLILGSAIKGLYVSNSFALNILNDNDKTNDEFGQFNLSLTTAPSVTGTFAERFHNYVYGSNSGPDDTKYDSSTKTQLENMGLMGKLIASGMSKHDANIRTLPTGFAPSAKLDDVSGEKIYKDALDFVSQGNVVAGIGKQNQKDPNDPNSVIKNANDTYNNYGSYIEVAIAIKIEKEKAKNK